VSSFDFYITQAQKQQLVELGRAAARAWIGAGEGVWVGAGGANDSKLKPEVRTDTHNDD
jgi:hypothetical protein